MSMLIRNEKLLKTFYVELKLKATKIVAFESLTIQYQIEGHTHIWFELKIESEACINKIIIDTCLVVFPQILVPF